MDAYFHNLNMQDKYTQPLTPHQIAEAFPECRDIANRVISQLSFELSYWKQIILNDPIAINFMSADPRVKQINFLKKYLELTEPLRDTINVSLAKKSPIKDMYEFKHARTSSTRVHCCCPFHDDKSPSFVIYLNSNTFNCFSGCGGGDAIEFYSRLNNTNFIETVKRLSHDL